MNGIPFNILLGSYVSPTRIPGTTRIPTRIDPLILPDPTRAAMQRIKGNKSHDN